MKANDYKQQCKRFVERFNSLYQDKLKTRDEDGRKYTQRRIARELGISDTSIRKYLDGDGSPSFENTLAIMDYFNVSFNWLIGRDEYLLDEAADGVERYGLSEKATMNLIKVGNGEDIADTDDYSIVSFNPIISGDIDGKTSYLIDDPFKFNPVRLMDDKADYSEDLVDMEAETLNMMIEDWDIIRRINAYLHSTSIEFAKKPGCDMFETDLVQLDLLNKALARKRSEIYKGTAGSRPEAYRIRTGRDGMPRMQMHGGQ